MQPTEGQLYQSHHIEFAMHFWESQGFREFNISRADDNWYRVQPVANEIIFGRPSPPPIEESLPLETPKPRRARRIHGSNQ